MASLPTLARTPRRPPDHARTSCLQGFSSPLHVQFSTLCTSRSNLFDDVTLDCMRKKLARRSVKLHQQAPESTATEMALQQASTAASKISAVLERRWQRTQDRDRARVGSSGSDWDPKRWNLNDNAYLKLKKVRSTLSELSVDSRSTPYDHAKFEPKCPSRVTTLHTFFSDPNDTIKLVTGDSSLTRLVHLYDFEHLVSRELESWAQSHKSTAIDLLASAIRVYWNVASSIYDNPERNSLMLLTVFDMWIVMDKLTCSDRPLLLDHPPPLPHYLLSQLILRDAASLRRVHAIAACLEGRASKADQPSVFDILSSASFAARFYDNDPVLRSKRQEIETIANQKRTSKIAQLKALNDEHREIMRKYNASYHED